MTRCRGRWPIWLLATRAFARCSRSAPGCRASTSWRRAKPGRCSEVGVVDEAGLDAALATASSRGFDLAHELPLRAHLFEISDGGAAAGSSTAAALALTAQRHQTSTSSMFFCWCCTTSPATAGRWGRCRGTSRRCTGHDARMLAAMGPSPLCPLFPCSTPTTRCGSVRCWARRATPTARLPASSRTGRRRWRICRSRSSCRPTGRGPRCRATAAATSPSPSRHSCMVRCRPWRATAGRACSWCCRPGWSHC